MVAFQAIKTAAQDAIGKNQNILFDKVTINIGNGFHPQHGIFIVPRSGLYIITATTLHVAQTTYFNGAIEHQGVPVAYIHGHENIGDQSTQTVLIQAYAGDEIWVRNIGPANVYIWGDSYSTFSGYLIWEN